MIHDKLTAAHRSQWRNRACTNCGHVEPWGFTEEDHRSLYVPRCSCGWTGAPTLDPDGAFAAHVEVAEARQIGAAS